MLGLALQNPSQQQGDGKESEAEQRNSKTQSLVRRHQSVWQDDKLSCSDQTILVEKEINPISYLHTCTDTQRQGFTAESGRLSDSTVYSEDTSKHLLGILLSQFLHLQYPSKTKFSKKTPYSYKNNKQNRQGYRTDILKRYKNRGKE